jgi:hypothetical protein
MENLPVVVVAPLALKGTGGRVSHGRGKAANRLA